MARNYKREYMNSRLQDYIWWYKKQAPKYGYFRSLFDCYFNSKYFTRDGNYKVKNDI